MGKREKREVEGWDVTKPLDRVMQRVFLICSATNKAFAIGYCRNTNEYHLVIGDDKFEGDIWDIEFQLSVTVPWRYCEECRSFYFGGRCTCQRYLYM
jgi:hypothetical protein